MTCPAPPGLFQLMVQYGISSSDWVLILITGGGLCLLGLIAFLLRRDARRLPPGPARRTVLLLKGTGGLLLMAILPLSSLSYVWQAAVSRWSASLSAECQEPSAKALIAQGSPIGLVVNLAILLLVIGSGFVLIELADRRKRRLEHGRDSG